MKKKKIFLTALTGIMAVSALASCSSKKKTDENTSNDNNTNVPDQPERPSDEHTVYFIVDGNVVGTATYKEGDTSILEYQVPKKDGYIGKWDSYTLGTKDVYVTARYFKLNVDYRVEYYLENLENSEYTISAKDTQTFSAKAYDSVIPTVKTFDHFTCTNPNIEGTVEEDGSTVLKLYYSRNTYTVNYVTNNGQTIAPQTVKYGTILTAPDLEKEGYNLDGFNVGNTPFNFNTPVSSDLTIEAKFSAKDNISYTVNYYLENLDNDEYTKVVADSYTTTGNTDETITATIKNYDGFDFEEAKSNVEATIAADGSTVLNVYYRRKRLNVTYISNTSSLIPPQTVKYGTKLTSLSLSKDGYDFKGFTYDGENFFNFNNPVTTDLTLTAVFAAKKVNYKINYYQQDLDGNYYLTDDSVDSQAFTGTKIEIDKLYQGFKVNTEKSTLEATVQADGSTVLNVYYDRKEFEVNFITNNGTELESLVVKYGELIEEPVLEKEGYDYLGWKLNDLDFNFTYTPITTNTTLECIFSPSSNTAYTMRYHYERANDDDYDIETSTYYGETGSQAEVRYRDKSHFTLTDTVDSKEIAPDGSTIIDVYYTRDRVSVSYQSGIDGVYIEPIQVKYGTAMKNLVPDLTREGYTCKYTHSSYYGVFDADCEEPYNYANHGTVFLTWTALPTTYKVEYYFENILDDEYTLYEDYTEILESETDAFEHVEVLMYEGFEYNEAISTFNGSINYDGSTVFKIYYKRERSTIKVYTGSEETIADIIAKYGAHISLEPISKQGYTFDGWYANNSSLWDFKNDTVTSQFNLYAKWTANTLDTKVEYYYENILDNDYTFDSTDYVSTTVGEDYELEYDIPDGFDVDYNASIISRKISADGSTVLKVYYKRNRYTINLYSQVQGYSFDPITIKYGQSLNLNDISAQISNPGYNFLYWYKGSDSSQHFTGEQYFSTDMSLYARFEAKNDIKYTVRYFIENIDDDEYTFDSQEVFTDGNVESSFANNNYPTHSEHFRTHFGDGFNDPSYTDTSIAADGSTVIDIYYQRNTYRLLVYTDSNVSVEHDNNEYYKLGTKVTINAIYENNLAYPYKGMYDTDGNLLTDDFKYEYTITAVQDYKIEIKTEMLAELEDFYFYADDKDITITGYYGNEKDIVIPDCVTRLEGQFGYDKYDSVTLGANVRELGDSVFAYTTTTQIIFNDKLEIIGYNAFAYSELGDIVLPDSVTEIGDNAFYESSFDSVYLPKNLKKIGNNAFSESYYTSIPKKLTINEFPKSLEIIGYDAFYNRELSQIVFEENSNLKEIGSDAFTRYNNNHDEIVDEAIYDIVIPASVEVIQPGAFKYLYINSLTFEENSNLREIGSNAFYITWRDDNEIVKMNNLVLPKSLENIYSCAFEGRYFESISFEEGTTIETIGENAFEGVKTDSFTFAPSIKHIEKSGFYQFIVDEIFIPNTVESLGESAFNWARIKKIIFEENSPITTIPKNAFYCCRAESIVLPDSLVYIEESAFYENYFEFIMLPSTVKTIGSYAFYNNYKLEIINVSESLYDIGESAFAYCNKIGYILNNSILGFEEGEPEYGLIPVNSNTIVYDKEESQKFELDGDLLIKHISSTETELVKYLGKDSRVELPNYLTSIRQKAFYNNDYINYVIIPNHVTTIGENAFYDCNYLYVVELGAAVTNIESYAFNGCNLLAEIWNKSSLSLTIGGNDYGYIAYYAFNVYTGNDFTTSLVIDGNFVLFNDQNNNEVYLLKYNDIDTPDGDLYIPDEVTYIYESAFYNEFSSNQNINIICNSNLKVIGASAFKESYITSIELNEGLKYIESNAFDSTHSIKDIVLPSTVLEIGIYAFEGSTIETITIDENLTSIGENAFEGSNIKYVTFEGNSKLESIGYSAFASTSIKSFYLGQYVSYIGGYAFSNTKIYEIKNDSSLVLTAGSDSFGHIAKYADNIYSSNSGSSRFHTDDNGFVYYEKTDNTGAILIDYVGEINENSDIVIPSNIIEIEDISAFRYATVNSLTISKNVKIIHDYAFLALKANLLTFEEGSKLEYMGEMVFNGSYFTQEVIELPDSLKYIGNNALHARCKTIIMPKSLETLSRDFMYNNTQLEYIIFKEDCPITTIESNIFYYCSYECDLNITIPVSVTNIKSYFSCLHNLNVFYYGRAEEYAQIETNEMMCSGTLTVYYYSETAIYDGQHWHLDENGYPVVWEAE